MAAVLCSLNLQQKTILCRCTHGWPGCEADELVLQVVKKQLVFLLLALAALLVAALLPLALAVARQAGAAAVRHEAPVPVADNNDYTCLGFPWIRVT